LLKWKTSFRGTTQIEYNLDEVPNVFPCFKRLCNLVWKYVDESIEIVEDMCVALCQF
jgi:hypothetical protein